jgi:3-oxoacyl-ACP reductase-like protein
MKSRFGHELPLGVSLLGRRLRFVVVEDKHLAGGVMKDKICIVTGGSTGIGKATVAGLAQRGATVAIACRDLDKGKSGLGRSRRRPAPRTFT